MRIDRSTLIVIVALCIAAVWMMLAALGDHPDGALLGFSGTLLLISGMDKGKNSKNGENRDNAQSKTAENQTQEG